MAKSPPHLGLFFAKYFVLAGTAAAGGYAILYAIILLLKDAPSLFEPNPTLASNLLAYGITGGLAMGVHKVVRELKRRELAEEAEK